jgi:hypothetical protein
MVKSEAVTQQLRRIKCDYAVWGRTEINELSGILMDDEEIVQAVNGYYDGGFAMLCVTNYRVLVVDKKPLALTVEDLRYDMIAEVDFGSRIVTAVLHIYTPLRTLIFTSWSIGRLRGGMNYIQQRVMELRNNEFLSSQFAQQAGAPRPNSESENTITFLSHVPQMTPHYKNTNMPPSEFEPRLQVQRPLANPYTKVPILARRRRYPSFY